MAYSPVVNCRGGVFIKSRKESYNFNSFKRLTKITKLSKIEPRIILVLKRFNLPHLNKININMNLSI